MKNKLTGTKKYHSNGLKTCSNAINYVKNSWTSQQKSSTDTK